MSRVAIGAIMKQEEPYILEWVYYHKALGFELIIADNGGQDNTSALLTALHNANIITRIEFRTIKSCPQIPAYRAILRYAKKNKIDILGFLDCDEFFTRKIPIQSLNPKHGSEYIKSEFEDKKATQISFHWLCYGSISNYTDLSLPVIERFSTHAEYGERRNVWVKSFVKVNEMFKFSNILFLGPQVLNVHYFQIANKQWYIENEKVIHFNYGKRISYETGGILHYQLKTWGEFQRKIIRGDVAHSINPNNKEYFDKLNFTNLNSIVDKEIIIQIKSGIQNLKEVVENNNNIPPKITAYKEVKTYLLSFGLSDIRGKKLRLSLYRIYKKWIKPLSSINNLTS